MNIAPSTWNALTPQAKSGLIAHLCQRISDLEKTIDALAGVTHDSYQVHYPTQWRDRSIWTEAQLRRAHNEFRRGVTTDVVALGEREWQRRRGARYRAGRKTQ